VLIATRRIVVSPPAMTPPLRVHPASRSLLLPTKSIADASDPVRGSAMDLAVHLSGVFSLLRPLDGPSSPPSPARDGYDIRTVNRGGRGVRSPADSL